VWTGVIPTVLFLALLARFLARFAPAEAPRRLTLVAYGLGSMAMVYSVLFIAHQLSAVCIGAAWILAVGVVDDGGATAGCSGAGLAGRRAPLVDYQAAFAGVPVAIYIAVRLWQTRRGWAPVAWAVAGAIGPIAILLRTTRVFRLAVEDRLRRLGDLRVPPPEGLPRLRSAPLGGLHRLDGGRRQRPGGVHAGGAPGDPGMGAPVAGRSARPRRGVGGDRGLVPGVLVGAVVLARRLAVRAALRDRDAAVSPASDRGDAGLARWPRRVARDRLGRGRRRGRGLRAGRRHVSALPGEVP
jgi:hypothetical protein